MYYKVENGVISSEPVPSFLKGITREDLSDLSWTDPQLGLSEAAWWPGEPVRFDSATHKPTGETLTLDAERRVVVVDFGAVPFTAREISEQEDEELNNRRQSMTISMRQCRLALLGAGLLDNVDAAIATLPEPDKSATIIAWEYGAVVERLSPFVLSMIPLLGLTDAEIDNLFEVAVTL